MIRTLYRQSHFSQFKTAHSPNFFSPMSRINSFRAYSDQVSPSKVKEIKDLTEFKNFVSSPDKLSVIDFYATWCGPCKALEPIFATLADRIPEVKFGRVDVDVAEDVALEYGITAMPTCILLKDGEKIETIVGANPPKLVELIQKHSGVDLSKR
ncbi:uncharacterized protein PRCAT00000234001 [Priceomyces carsonii]|uniref:uncharacterized protein n=1 Tax=Priceomyces carsonii TaxID=28549 RepID=UPI002ED84121|nr:unnamed protein product [Priceomyces carsonii]